MFQVFKALYTKTTEGNNTFSEMLRFVVIRPDKRHSLCLYINQSLHWLVPCLTGYRAIHTYSGRATTAAHARTRDHIVIYTGDEPPELVVGESETIWNRRPILLNLDPKGEPLDPASRLNVSKVHTIDHDIQVAKLGKISSRDVERLRQYSGISTSSSQALDDLEEYDEDDPYG
jgi:hypothetical protein